MNMRILSMVMVLAANRPESPVSPDREPPQLAINERPPATAPHNEQAAPQRPAEERPSRPVESPAKSVAMNDAPPAPATLPTPKPAPAPAPSTPTPAPAPPRTTPDPKKDEEVTKALNAARVALSKSDVRAARAHVHPAAFSVVAVGKLAETGLAARK